MQKISYFITKDDRAEMRDSSTGKLASFMM